MKSGSITIRMVLNSVSQKNVCFSLKDAMKFSKEDCFNRSLNWNIEIFDPFRQENEKDSYIPYLFHTVFEDGSVYSLEDLMLMEPEDFIIETNVNFWMGENENSTLA